MDTDTGFDNTFVAGLDAEEYFIVNLQLVGCKIYNKHITHDNKCRIYYFIQVTVIFRCKQDLNNA